MRVNKYYVIAFFLGVGAAIFMMRPNTHDLVRMHELSGDAAKAKEILEGLYQQSPRDPEVIAGLARLCRSTGKTEDAIRFMQKLRELEPENSEHYETLISFYYETKQTRLMLDERERLIAVLEKKGSADAQRQLSDSEFVEIKKRLLREYHDLAALYSSLERPYKQADLYKRAMKVMPREKTLTVNYINLLLAYQSPPDLLPLLDAAVENFPNDKWIIDVAIGAAFKQGDPARAERFAREGIKGLGIRNTEPSREGKRIRKSGSGKRGLREAGIRKESGIWQARISHPASNTPTLQHINTPSSTTAATTNTGRSRIPDSDFLIPSLSLHIHLTHALRLQQDNPAKLQQYLDTSLAAWQRFGDRFRIYDTIDLALKKQKFDFAKRAIALWKKKAPDTYAPWQIDLYRYAPESGLDAASRLELFLAARKRFPGQADIVQNIAGLAHKLQRWQLAAQYWELLIKSKPDKLDVWQGYLHSLAQFDKAAYQARLAEAIGKFDDSELQIRMQEERAYHAQNAGDWNDAIRQWVRLIDKKPNHLLYYKNRMYCIQKSGDAI
ncbi:MAG: tetratricopeptide repeat protein, partial [Planctomycetota bacterium]|nr:tetratricopeptide repeat protein [Planctomycetota bacterium]